MQRSDDTDSLRLLRILARAYPEPVDLDFEAWVLGLSDERMSQALGTLLSAGCVHVEAATAALRPLMRQARATDKGISAARQMGLMPVSDVERRRSARDRRVAGASASVPPPGLVERRRSRQDRRVTFG